jgi:predicted TIM-barrel fold metal-dependent hydrolase
MIIDAYSHILPKKYQEAIDQKVTGRDPKLAAVRYSKTIATLVDLDVRFRIMDMFEGYVQVISIAGPHSYSIADPPLSVELAQIANDGLAELIHDHPGRFVGGIATLPMNDPDAAVREAERAVKELRLRAVEVFTDVNGIPLDDPRFFPLFEMMESLGRPVFLHPKGPEGEINAPDYPGEEKSIFRIWAKLRWPYATSMAMCRLVYGGIMERLPGLKVVTHHCGGAIPYLAGRLDWGDDFGEMRMGEPEFYLKEKSLNYFRRFFLDTATNGNAAALKCGAEFAGIEQMLFGTDMPFDNQIGERLIRETISAVERMGLSEEDRDKVFRGNAVRLLKLPVGES